MNQKLLDPKQYTQELMEEYEEVKKKLDKAMQAWEESQEKLERLQA